MVIDIILAFTLIAFGGLGWRDASARKLTSIAVCIIGMFVAHYFMQDLGQFLIKKLHYQPETAPVAAFLMIFLVLFLLQFALYRPLTHNYKFGGIVDKIFGVPLGLVEGVIFISIVIFVINMQGPPRERTVRDSRLYRPVASVAPQIFDLFSTVLPAAQQTLENVAAPGATGADSLTPESVKEMTSPEAAKVDSVLQRAR